MLVVLVIERGNLELKEKNINERFREFCIVVIFVIFEDINYLQFKFRGKNQNKEKIVKDL